MAAPKSATVVETLDNHSSFAGMAVCKLTNHRRIMVPSVVQLIAKWFVVIKMY